MHPESILVDSWDESAAAKLKWFECFEKSYGRVTERLIELCGLKNGMKVLDVGTGLGEPAITAAGRVGESGQVVGVDSSSVMIGLARQRAARAGLNALDFAVMDAQRLEFPNGSFDAVLSRLVLMFLPDPVGALCEMRRVLGTEGRLAVAVLGPPDKTPLVWLWERALGGIRHPKAVFRTPFHLADLDTLGAAVTKAGFRDVSTEPVAVTFDFVNFDEFVDYLKDNRTEIEGRLSESSPREREKILSRLRVEAAAYERPDGCFRLTGQSTLVAAMA